MARYDYIDLDGQPVLRALRYDPKGFSQQKHNGQRWVNGAPSAQDRILYRLREVVAAAAAGQTIHVCEGEKDADAVTAAGAIATTAPMGADKWQPQYTRQLEGAGLVLIWRDRDHLHEQGHPSKVDAGTRQAVSVRDALRAAGIRCQVIEAASGKDAADHLADGMSLDQVVPVSDTELEQSLQAAADDQDDVRTSRSDDRGGGELIEHPTSSRLPDPSYVIPMASRQRWRYELGGEGRRSRGVYTTIQDNLWAHVAPLPYVLARIVLRDGLARRIGSAYLLASEADGQGVVVDDEELRTNQWASRLGVALSVDDKVQKSVVTAIIYAAQEAPEREQTPRVVDGQIALPLAETIIPGYLHPTDLVGEELSAAVRDTITAAASSPRLALIMGASAIGPFVAATGRQSHIVSVYGDPGQGKSTALTLAASIWGRVDQHGVTIVRPWNTTAIGAMRYLGELGCLPAVMDELGQSSIQGPAAWGKFIYDVCETGGRMGGAQRGGSFTVTKPWAGVMFSGGNGRMTEGLGAGRFAGVARRVVEIPTPLTLDETHADTVTALAEQIAGHLGAQLLERHSVETVRPLIDQAAELLGYPESAGPSERTIARHLHAHIAGAALLDEIAGTGQVLTDAALTYAHEYMAELAPPEHDADRLLAEIRDAIAREPAMWPTQRAYEESLGERLPMPLEGGPGSAIPVHGVNRTVLGIQSDPDKQPDTSWVAVFPTSWREAAERLGVDQAVACRELYARGVLQVTESRRRRHEWKAQIKLFGRPTELYKLVLPPLEDDDSESATSSPTPSSGPAPKPPSTPPTWPTRQLQTGPLGEALPSGPIGEPATELDGPVTTSPLPLVGGGRSPGRGSVGGAVGASKSLLTCTVGGVGGELPSDTYVPARETPQHLTPALLPRGTHRGCVICRTPAEHLIDGRAVHLGECLRQLREGFIREDSKPPAGQEGKSEGAPSRERRTSLAGRREAASTANLKRFAAAAVVLDAANLYLPDGEVRDWPCQPTHLGDLAMLAGRDHLRLGHGGGEVLPSEGQIWLWDAAALGRLGLPGHVDIDEDGEDDDVNAAARKAFAELDEHPMVANAKAAGWEFGQGGHLNTYTKLWHPELLREGVYIVARPWNRLTRVPMLVNSQDPSELVHNLCDWANTVGQPFLISPAVTALELVDHTRPPLRADDERSGSHATRRAVRRDEPAELPPFVRSPDSRTRIIEADYSWWRPFSTLLEDEKTLPYVHAYDRGASYLAQWSGLDLGISGLIHRTGADAGWDGTQKPGYFLYDAIEWPDWLLPEPTRLAIVEDGRMWGTSHTLRQLQLVGATPVVHESYTWTTTARYLDKAAAKLRAARDSTNLAVSQTAKAAYASGTGKFAERRNGGRQTGHLWRPDWTDHVKAAARTGILLTLMGLRERAGINPLAVARDTIVIASAEADPVTAWPGDPAKLGTKPGQWKPEASGRLDEWAPTWLSERGSRYWRHVQALDALKNHT